MNKHIPIQYKKNTRDIRLRLLAGLIDSNGHCSNNIYYITLKNEKLIDDIIFICRSLGFSCYKKKCLKVCTNSNNPKANIYFSISISGEFLENIPCLLPRKKVTKRQQKKNVVNTGFKINLLGEQECYHINLNTSGEILLGDFTLIDYK